MPRQEGVWGVEADQAQQVLSADGLAFHSQSAAWVVVEARAFSQLFFEHADFLFEVFNDDLLEVVHPSGKADQQQGQGIHAVIIVSTGADDEHFVGIMPLPFIGKRTLQFESFWLRLSLRTLRVSNRRIFDHVPSVVRFGTARDGQNQNNKPT
jgi:hypothetical protein